MGQLKLTPGQYKEVLETHSNYSATNLFTWRDTWILLGFIVPVTSIIISYYVNGQIKDAIDVSKKEIEEKIGKACPNAVLEHAQESISKPPQKK